MISRRSFLGGAAATLVAAGCYPPIVRAGDPTGAGAPASGARRLRAMAGLDARRTGMLGYPVNMSYPPDAFFEWRRRLASVGVDRFPFNNVGDPTEHGHYPFNTHAIERDVVARFARQYGFPADDAWGFVTHSGTDSNMHGMYVGRTVLRARTGRTPRVYFTDEAHYSIQILADLLGLEWVPVAARPGGEMDEDDLARLLDERPDEPALVVLTVGTTFKGAVDPIDAVNAALRGRESYVHLDAALFGGYLPRTAHAPFLAHEPPGHGAPRYDSIAVSCHKFFGLPSPAGIFVCSLAAFEEFHLAFARVHDPAYILHVPGTITCSRDAVKPAEFLFYASDEDAPRQRDDAARILRDTDYLIGEMRSRLSRFDPVRAGPMSNTVYFRRPRGEVVERWVLATMDVERDGETSPHAHVVVMPHARRAVLDRFLEDMERAG